MKCFVSDKSIYLFQIYLYGKMAAIRKNTGENVLCGQIIWSRGKKKAQTVIGGSAIEDSVSKYAILGGARVVFSAAGNAVGAKPR